MVIHAFSPPRLMISLRKEGILLPNCSMKVTATARSSVHVGVGAAAFRHRTATISREWPWFTTWSSCWLATFALANGSLPSKQFAEAEICFEVYL